MGPTLDQGDRLLVLRLPARWPIRPGAIVAVPDPRESTRRTLVKRVHALGPEGIDVRGDNAGSSTDSRHFGPVPRRAGVGLVVYRYGPPQRRGPVR